jgi:hypothetical protein
MTNDEIPMTREWLGAFHRALMTDSPAGGKMVVVGHSVIE